MIKFLPSYVGSKAYWVERLRPEIEGKHIVEPFCGSAVISANLSSISPVLNDTDFFISEILSRFDEQIVPDSFSPADYFATRPRPDWWKYAFCLQKMSFSGVFRYSKNGFNVPIKDKDKEKVIHVRPEYDESLAKWRELQPIILNKDYSSVSPLIRPDSVVIVDPPYESTQASYNNLNFDYHVYWEWVRLNENAGQMMIVFDFEGNSPFFMVGTKKSRVNGARAGNVEGYFKFENSFKEGEKGERQFAEIHSESLVWLQQPYKPDFQVIKTGDFVELKTDYYNTKKTNNFFFERYSNVEKGTNGGPWQALDKNSRWFVYFFPANNTWFIFETEKLVQKLELIIDFDKFTDIPNKTWTTRGYKVSRESVKDIYIQKSKNET